MLIADMTVTARLRILLPVLCLFACVNTATSQVSVGEYAERRTALLDSAPDGIVLLKANASEKYMEQPGWIQNASFYYFTGLGDQPSAILALDGPRKETHLFVPPAPLSFGVPVQNLSQEPGPESGTKLGLSTVQSWDAFQSYIRGRLAEGVEKLYLEKPRRPEPTGAPQDMVAVSGRFFLWEQSVRTAFPKVQVDSITDIINQMRWIKSPAEIAILRANASMTATALMEGARAIGPGKTQRDAESAVVSGCLASGAQGPSFWPWTMSGPNTHFEQLVRSFYDYESLNRTMLDGELVRVDVGCASGFYGGDVGRTIPVSGYFTEEQARVWNLLIAGYMAGLDAMRPGIELEDVREASRQAIRNTLGRTRNDQVQRIAEAMLDEQTGVNWHIHGVGVESGEAPGPTLETGVVLAYEPMFSWKEDAFYLEDMIVISRRGAEILSSGLPYAAAEIANALDER